MIGDWMYNAHHKRNIRITPYDFFTHGRDAVTGEQYLLATAKPCWGRDLIPIPLTPEILEKNGFQFTGTCTWQLHEKNLDIFVVPVQPDNEWWDEFSTRIEVCTNRSDFLIEAVEQIYVHQLQQMLRLCGIEKEIKLP